MASLDDKLKTNNDIDEYINEVCHYLGLQSKEQLSECMLDSINKSFKQDQGSAMAAEFINFN